MILYKQFRVITTKDTTIGDVWDLPREQTFCFELVLDGKVEVEFGIKDDVGTKEHQADEHLAERDAFAPTRHEPLRHGI